MVGQMNTVTPFGDYANFHDYLQSRGHKFVVTVTDSLPSVLAAFPTLNLPKDIIPGSDISFQYDSERPNQLALLYALNSRHAKTYDHYIDLPWYKLPNLLPTPSVQIAIDSYRSRYDQKVG